MNDIKVNHIYYDQRILDRASTSGTCIGIPSFPDWWQH